MLDKFLNWAFGRGKDVVEFGVLPLVSFALMWALQGEAKVAVILVFLLVYFVLVYERVAAARENGRLESNSFAAGSLSKHLAPKLRRILEGSATFYITESGAGALLSWRSAVWRRFLREALKRGSTVNYIMTDVDRLTDKRRLMQLKTELEIGTDGVIHFCFFTRWAPDNDEDKKLWSSLQTFHPILVEDSKHQRVMWIEGYHPIGNEEWAYSVEFLMPEDAARDKRYDKYKELLDRVIGKYGTSKEAQA